MRRLVILGLLLGMMELLRPLGSAGYGAQALLIFGFLVLAAYTIGEVAKAMHAPKIVGYLAAGLIFGPSVLDVLGAPALGRLAPVSDLAVGLIAFLAGAELRWSEVRQHGSTFVKIMSVELLLSFVALTALLYGLSYVVPVLKGLTTAQAVAFSLVFASVAIVHSPAVTMALLTETGARGPVARTTLGVVLLTDVAVVVFFSGVLAVARQLVPQADPAAVVSAGGVLWEIGGALLVGAVLGLGVTFYLRFINHELLLFALLLTFLGVELTRLLHVETLLTLLTAGFIAENVSREGRGEALRHAMERSAAPVFVVFFALSGAKIDIRAIASVILVVIPVVLVRAGAIYTGTQIGGRWAGVSAVERRHVWMGLISQAGVAIGLATVVAEAYPGLGSALRTLLLSAIAINEAVGPILFRRALVASGEVEAALPGAQRIRAPSVAAGLAGAPAGPQTAGVPTGPSASESRPVAEAAADAAVSPSRK